MPAVMRSCGHARVRSRIYPQIFADSRKKGIGGNLRNLRINPPRPGETTLHDLPLHPGRRVEEAGRDRARGRQCVAGRAQVIGEGHLQHREHVAHVGDLRRHEQDVR